MSWRRCFKTKGCFLFGSVCLDICKRNNRNLMWNKEHNLASNWNLDMFCPATGTKSNRLYVSYLYVAVLALHCSTELSASLFPLCTHRFMHVTIFVCPTSGKWVHLLECQWGVSAPRCTKSTCDSFCRYYYHGAAPQCQHTCGSDVRVRGNLDIMQCEYKTNPAEICKWTRNQSMFSNKAKRSGSERTPCFIFALWNLVAGGTLRWWKWLLS